MSLTQSNYYGFKHGNYLRTNVDIPTVKIEHDVNDAISISDAARYAHYVRQFDITEPQFFTTASETTLGASGVQALIAPGTPLSSLDVARNQLYGHSLETYLDNQLDATLRSKTGFVDHTMRTGLEVGRETSDPVRYTTIGPYSLTPLLSPNPSDTFNAEALSLSAATGPLPPVKNKSYELGTKWEFFDARISVNGALFHTSQENVSEPDPNNPLVRAI